MMNDVVKVADDATAAYAETKSLYLDTICCHEPGQAVPARAREQFQRGLKQRLITKEKVASMALEVTGLICQMNKAALDVLPAAPDRGARRLFCSRVMCREYQHLRRERTFLVKRMQKDSQFRHNHEVTSEARTDTTGTVAPHHPASDVNDISENVKEDMRTRYKQAGKQMKSLQCQQVHKARKMQIKKLRSIFHANRKQGNKMIFNKDAPHQRLDSVKDMPSGKILTDRVDVKRAVQDYFVSLMQKPKQGDTDLGAMPWEERGKKGLDPFVLQQGQHGPATCRDEQDMLLQMDDVGVLKGLLNHLARGKAAGPDGVPSVPNELLQALPCKLQEAIRRLFVVMWLSGHTPDEWKVSKTVLLYKKGDPIHLQNWRPIARANTLYKPWTSMGTHLLSTYGERQGIIGSAQEGFRRYRNTSRQLQMAIHMIEDAAQYHQDLYSLYIDFSSAFNTVNHERLILVMHKLGFPSVAISTVQDIYTMHAQSYRPLQGIQMTSLLRGAPFRATLCRHTCSWSSLSRCSGGSSMGAVGIPLAA